MKKISKILIIFGFLIIATGCSKKMISTDNFIRILKNEKITYYDMTNKMPSSSNIKEATIGSMDDKWKVEYYIFKDEKSANQIYTDNENKLKTAKNMKSTNSSKDDHYSKFEVITEDHYMVVIRNKESVLYSVVLKEYKDDLTKVISRMNY